MNIRNLKLKLATELINQNKSGNVIRFVRDYMKHLKGDAGKFIRVAVLQNLPLRKGISMQRYALQYENFTLDIDLLHNQNTREQVLQNFRVH